jgi:hypothetical protein
MWIFGVSVWSWIRSASRLTLLCVVKSRRVRVNGFAVVGWLLSGRHRGVQGAVELAGDVALEAAPDLLVGRAFGAAPGDVGPGGRAAAHPGGGDGVDRPVERPVTALVEPVAHGGPLLAGSGLVPASAANAASFRHRPG